MTVQELIERLKPFPSDALVVTEGYEGGFDTIKKTSLIMVDENPDKNWWVGKYIDSDVSGTLQVVFLNAETKADSK